MLRRLSQSLIVVALATALLPGCPAKRPPDVAEEIHTDHTEPEQGRGHPETHEAARPHTPARRDDAADRALEQALQTAQSTPNRAKAAEMILAVRRAYPDTTAAEEALYRAGVLYFDAGDYVNARRSLNTLLFEDPLFDKAADAKAKLGAAALEVGAYRDAYQSLSSLAERATGEERERLLEEAARAAEGALLFGEALKIAVQFADEAKTSEEQARALTRVTNLIEGKVPFLDIAKAAQEIKPSSPVWPILTFKLARIYYHLRDWTRLRETLGTLLDQAPGSPLAPQAREMLDRASFTGTDVKPKRVGIVLPLSGKYQPFGEAVMRGVKLALEGSDIEIQTKDTQGDINLSGKAVEDLAFEQGAIGIIGPVLADDSKRAGLVAEELHIPLLTLTLAEGITDIGPHVFRNMVTYSAQAQAIVDYATRYGVKSWGILYPNTQYGTALTNEVWDQIQAHGGEVRAAEKYEHDQTTFTEQVERMVGRKYLEDRLDFVEGARDIREDKSTDPFHRHKQFEKHKKGLESVIDFDAIFLPDDWKKVGILAPALAVEDIITNACDPKDLEKIKKTTGKKNLKTVTLFGWSGWSSKPGASGLPELLERGGKFVTCSVYVDGFYVDSARPATRKFVRAFQAAYKDLGRPPNLLEAAGYDAGGMLREVIEKSKPQTREALRDALARLKDYDGAMGKTFFNEHREGQKPLFFLTIDNKGVHEVSPTAKIGGS